MAVHFHPNIHWFSFIKNVSLKVCLLYTHWPSFPFIFESKIPINQSSKDLLTSHTFVVSVGYTMADIRYKWNDGLNSVQVSGDVSLPQFKVLGHRQKTIEASLSTGQSGLFCYNGTFSHSHLNLCVCL